MQNARLDDAQSGIKIPGRNVNNLRYTDDTTLMAESEEELKSRLMRVKEESEKAGLKLNIQKTKIMAFDPITSWQIEGEKVETVTDFSLLGLQNHSCPFKEQASFNFKAAVIVCRDFGDLPPKKSSLFPLFPLLFAMK